MKTVWLQLLLVIAAVIGSVSGAAAQWTTVGSAGTVDEADLAEFETISSQVRIRDSVAAPAVIVVRYNVVNVAGMSGGDGIAMIVRYRDNGIGARVNTVLRQINVSTGVTTTVMTLDSNSFPSSAAFQMRSISNCTGGFDFDSNAYFIESTLTKSATEGAPAIQAIVVGITLC